ncbi:LppP/LprE family lipoprotein [Alicyclobacillus tolerans]|uniref:LppP/LprE family lipoprotein n=1 Tax=Alicyclobacillus tolerans TaxID=90970 RepID=UPI001F312FFB|nr:LppP/LprE family lipoprotein [Alicyclobacillus tolerans]MCF8566725.1 LppP/LprE family lipoprotein [Alicyclobacillus tolerans]
MTDKKYALLSILIGFVFAQGTALYGVYASAQTAPPAQASSLSMGTPFAKVPSTKASSTNDSDTAQIPKNVLNAVMNATSEKSNPDIHFSPFPLQITVPDGHGGTLTAVGGTRFPTADGLGQVVFFFHNGEIADLSSDKEAISVLSIKPAGTGSFAITYANYRPTDPMVHPTLPPQTITYTWNGNRMVPSAHLDSGATNGIEVVHTW